MASKPVDRDKTQADEEIGRRLKGLWSSLVQHSTYEQREESGITYLRHVIGADENTIKAFLGDTKSLEFPTNPEKTLNAAREIIRETTLEQMRQITRIYIQHMLGLTEQQLQYHARQEFEERSKRDAWEFVGYRHTSLKKAKDDYASFWKAVNVIFPGLHAEEDIHWLSEQGREGAAFFLWRLENRGSRVLNELSTNAHAYR